MSPRFPWNDRAGRFAPLKAATFALLFTPGVVIALSYGQGGQGPFGPRPLQAAIQTAGLWAIRLLLLSLAITPLRRTLRWPALAGVRRMIGVAACAYACVHFLGFAADKLFDLGVVATEIVLRYYLTIGATTLLLLLTLAATSTDGMMRRLGPKRWQALHRLVHAAAVLASVHFFMQSKLNATEPTIMAGLLAWLLAWRVAARKGRPLSFAGLVLLSVAVAAATALGEAAFYALFTGVDPWRVLAANVALFGQRPAGIVLMAGLGVTLLSGVLSAWRGRSKVAAAIPEVP
ncbi:MAG: ferric reductase-like transmembrane domain-containing protein [Alphaproteobacteria bacterium]|nr:ferric reductase-like transmembrane domain-containing protein [Alphaproteobacteria bacterium]